MGIRKYISFVLFVLGSIVSNAQLDTTHRLISTAGGAKTFLPVGKVDSINISWTIGEVIVFNDVETIGSANPTRFTLSQSMQSYPPFLEEKNCHTTTVANKKISLCEGTSINIVLSYNSFFNIVASAKPVPESVQWYFSEDSTTKFSKIVGANSNTYSPYFPGFYKVVAKYKDIASCKDTFSTSSEVVKTLSNSINPPLITPSGLPISLLTATASNATLQWYVYVAGPNLNKYLMIAGGNKPSQKIRYRGSYMVIATFPSGCRLSSTFDIVDNRQFILRATDFRIEGNTIYIPDEEAPEHSALSVYPNPTLGDFVVRFQSTDEITANAQLYSNTGVFVKEIVFTEGSAWSKQAKIETDDLSAGVYFLKVNQDNKHLVQKVVIYK